MAHLISFATVGLVLAGVFAVVAPKLAIVMQHLGH